MTLVHALADIARGMVFSGSEGGQLARDQARHGAAVAGRLLRLVPHAVVKRYRVKLIVRSGRPYQLIADVASEIKADLIVMGMPRRRGSTSGWADPRHGPFFAAPVSRAAGPGVGCRLKSL